MTNERLRGAMLQAEVSPARLASTLGVDTKTISRWLAGTSVPYPQTRVRIARALRQRESYLWPALAGERVEDEAALAELDRLWPTRSSVSSESWHDLFNRSSRQIDILVYAGGFLVESLDLDDVLRLKASQGAEVRLLVGEATSEAVRLRAAELSMPWLPARCASTSRYLAPLRSQPRIEVRSHGTTLYASTFRFDDVLLLNAHAYGVWAAHSPTLRVRQSASSSLFDFYSAAFERVWKAHEPMESASAIDQTGVHAGRTSSQDEMPVGTEPAASM